jgi:hypothetical protein
MMAELRCHCFGDAFEEVVAPALFGGVPIGIVVGVFGDEALGVRHEAEDAAGVILQAGNLGAGAVDVLAIEQGGAAILDILFSIAGLTDESALGVGDGQFEVIGKSFEEGAGVAVLFQRSPAANETASVVVNQAAARQEVQLSEDLEAIADAKHVTAIRHELFQALTELVLGDELGNAAAHDVVAIAEATGKNDELGLVKRGRLQVGDGQDFSGEARSFQGAGGFQVAIGAREFNEKGVGHERYVYFMAFYRRSATRLPQV